MAYRARVTEHLLAQKKLEEERVKRRGLEEKEEQQLAAVFWAAQEEWELHEAVGCGAVNAMVEAEARAKDEGAGEEEGG